MDPETKRLLEESLVVAKENNEMLKKVVRNQKWAAIYRTGYWFVIILFSFGAYYFVKPLMGNMLNLYSGGVSNMVNISDISKSLGDKKQMDEWNKLINDLNKN